MLGRFLVVTIFLLCLIQSAPGEPYPKHLYNGVKNSFDNPVWLVCAGGIYLLSRFDKPVHNSFPGKLFPKPIAKVGDYYGQGVNFGLSSAYFVWEANQNNLSTYQLKKNVQYHAEAYMLNLFITASLKEIIKRWRPDGSNHRSFPSGHTSSSFVVAAMMQKMYGRKVGTPAFILACVSGLQRLHADKHWLTDVLSGALLGTLIGNGFGELLKENSDTSPTVITLRVNF